MERLKFSAFLADVVIELVPRTTLLSFRLVKLGFFPEKAMIKKLIRCSACNQVIPNYEGYSVTQDQSLPGVDWSDADLAMAKEFLRAHSGHPLEELTVEKESSISEKPAYEPTGVTYILASNAHRRKFLIRRTRMALDQPAFYAIIPGKLRISNVSLRIQEYDLRKQIAAEKGFSLLLKRKMEKFIEAFRDEIAGISPKGFEAEAEAIEEGENSLIAYGSLNESQWARILKRCGRFFKESELKKIGEFIEENRIPPDVLSVQIKRRISIISSSIMESAEGRQILNNNGMAVENETDSIAEIKAAKNRR